MRDNLPRINKPRYAHTIMNKLCKARIFWIRTRQMLQISNPQNFTKKNRRWNIFFLFELKKSISSMRFKQFFLEILFRAVKIDWIKNHTEHRYSVFFESRNKNSKYWNLQKFHFLLDLATLSTQKAPDHSWNVFSPAKLVCISFEGSSGQITAWYNCFLKNRMLIVRR